MKTHPRKRILFLAHRVPYPPDKGDKIRGYHVLQYLCERYEVHLACLCDDDKDWAQKDALRQLTPHYYVEKFSATKRQFSPLLALSNDMPISVAAFYSNKFRQYLLQLTKKEYYDVIYVFSSNVAFYAKELNAPLKIVDFCDLDSVKFKEFATKRKWPLNKIFEIEYKKLAQYEREIAKHYNYILFVNDRERELFRYPAANGKIRIIGNGVQVHDYQNLLKVYSQQYDGQIPYLVFLGMMSYYPNVEAAFWFATQVFPRIKVLIPDLEFYIVGKNPPAKIRRLHNPRIGIYVTGYMEKIDLLLAKAIAFVAPIKTARGVQTKILDAMSHGVPVVTTPDAARALSARDGYELLVASTEAEFVHAILSILYNLSLRKRIIKGAIDLLKNQFDWTANLSSLSELIDTHYHRRVKNGKLSAFSLNATKAGARS
ncbi:MAG: TIGR03087 family PEP-CTERM/XrtA system glycosyltransferase [candidate division KSB1 bacterium]|nr:TIGR03087 family PEP-CTERM/XrtA system glycosyltransferase [candidate division KSB1 bacterium]